MSSEDITVVTGASRGFGRAVATALCESGRPVVGVARDREALQRLRTEHGPLFTPVVADVADPATAILLIDEHRPRAIVLAAGATPLCRPVDQLTWEAFSRNWDVDVAQAFHWTREALLRPLEPGSAVVSFSSGAALSGSPVSGGYAGAKATVRFIADYAAAESELRGLGITFASVLPGINPGTDLGTIAVQAYARRNGRTPAETIAGMGTVPTPAELAGHVLDLLTGKPAEHSAYRVSTDGLQPV